MRTDSFLQTLVVVVCAVLACTLEARAQPSSRANRAKAEKLYEEALGLVDSQDYASACPKIEEVIKLVPEGIGGKVTLGDCYKGWMRLASAVRAYDLAENAARSAGDTDREKKAHERAEELRPKVSKLTILVTDAIRSLPGLEVKLDGVGVAREQWGTAIFVDGGMHQIQISATGRRTVQKSVDIAASGASESVDVGLLIDTSVNGPAPKSSLSVAPTTPRPNAKGSLWSTPRKIGVVVGIVGVAGVAAGSYFGLQSKAKRDDSRAGSHCVNGNLCDQAGALLLDEAITAGNVSTALFIPGTIFLLGGVGLLIWSPRAAAEPSAHVALGLQGMELVGRW